MPNRHDNQPVTGPGAARPGDRAEPQGEGREPRSFGPGFRAEDARLTADMKRYDRGHPTRADYGHDQNYRPGYHEGGSRFGFFGLDRDHPAPAAPNRPSPNAGDDLGYSSRPQADREFDPDYLSWRDQQMRRHDRDYADWRREQHQKYDDDYWKFRSERREDFHQRFQDWRAQRDTEIDPSPPDDKI